MSIRLNKYNSDSGYCSRREADRLIEMGRVLVNGETATIGTMVTNDDSVDVDDTILKVRTKLVYIALNKPVGITCTTDPSDPDNIASFMNYRSRIFNIGRLDKDSEGLILMTNDGDIVNKILRAENDHEKEYVVEVNRTITDDFARTMSSGVRIMGIKTRPCRIIREGERRFRIILTQGMNRQIRRMCAALDYDVIKLKRVRIMNIKLDKLPLGDWRYLTAQELETLNLSLEGSESTPRPAKKKYGAPRRPFRPYPTARTSGEAEAADDTTDAPKRSYAPRKGGAPKGRAPKSAAPRGGAPKSAAPKSAAPKSGAPKSAKSSSRPSRDSFDSVEQTPHAGRRAAQKTRNYRDYKGGDGRKK